MTLASRCASRATDTHLAPKRVLCVLGAIVLHEGYSPDDIVGLADQDNENDEYHTEVPVVGPKVANMSPAAR